jgi:hypothetical protein
MADETQNTVQINAESERAALPNPVETMADIELHREYHRRIISKENPGRKFELLWTNQGKLLQFAAISLDGKGPLDLSYIEK